MPVFSPNTLARCGKAVFAAVGAPEAVARRVADALVDANLAGHDSHGVIRIPQYVEAVEGGEVVPDAEPKVLRETAVSALVDGGWGFGQVTALRAAEIAVARAKAQGLAAVGCVRVNHIGRVGEYPERMAREGVVGFVVAGGFGGRGGRAAPFGGREGILGTNPLSFGIPADDLGPMLVDFATTAVAAGKIQVARAKGEPLPPGSILDRDGNPTTNAEDFYQGGVMLPFGGHKGYALSLVVELLGRVLTGADEHAEGGRGGAVYGRSGALVLAIDPGLFRDPGAFRRGVDETLRRVKAAPPAPGFDAVMVPGEPEARTRAQRLREGIYVEDATVAAIHKTAAALGLAPDAVLADA
ncbi:MAG TPA: Ldh family oxidoreductase [Chloroflexota bacterium]|jgi:LDH2 family malate/lactate/ureidoglycolate dehydrogenase|nr:Ldh family oxidoreductase [Chloroflexota bacterium]